MYWLHADTTQLIHLALSYYSGKDLLVKTVQSRLLLLKYKSADIRSGLLCSNRQKAGLGNPPAKFTTNASESMNVGLVEVK